MAKHPGHVGAEVAVNVRVVRGIPIYVGAEVAVNVRVVCVNAGHVEAVMCKERDVTNVYY